MLEWLAPPKTWVNLWAKSPRASVTRVTLSNLKSDLTTTRGYSIGPLSLECKVTPTVPVKGDVWTNPFTVLAERVGV